MVEQVESPLNPLLHLHTLLTHMRWQAVLSHFLGYFTVVVFRSMHIPPTKSDPFRHEVHIFGSFGARQVAHDAWHLIGDAITQRPPIRLPKLHEVQNLLSPGIEQVAQEGSQGVQVPFSGLKAVPVGQTHMPLSRVETGSTQPVQPRGVPGITQLVQLGWQGWQIPYWSKAVPTSQAQKPSIGNRLGSVQDRQAELFPGVMQAAQSGPQSWYWLTPGLQAKGPAGLHMWLIHMPLGGQSASVLQNCRSMARQNPLMQALRELQKEG